MNRRGRRDTDSNTNISMIVFATIIVIAIVAFILSYMLYSRKLNTQAKTINNTQKISSVAENNMMNIIENTEAASSSIGKSVNEMENTVENTLNTDKTEKMAINTSNIEKKQTESKQTETNQTNNKDISINEEQIEETAKDPSFIKPV